MPNGVDVVPGALTLRRAAQRDDAFLRQLHAQARPELQLLPPELVELQFAAQRTQYRLDHPHSIDEIVELGGEPVGRCWTADEEGELHLLDLAVRADRRRVGIGRAALGILIDRAAASGRVVRLKVWSANLDARRLYHAVGFGELGEHGGYLSMGLVPERAS